jgi:hypothetical protein
MSFRSRLYVFAIGVITLGLFIFSVGIVLEYKQGHANERNSAAQYYANATKEGINSCGAIMDKSGVFDWLTCLADKISADGGEKQAEYDLKAQQDMAVWAFGMLIVTVWLAVITFLGVVFVWRTLIATQFMAGETTRIGEAQAQAARVSVQQAIDANNIARAIAQDVDRPFVFITQRFDNEGRWRDGNEGGEWLIEFRNYGRNPAIVIEATAITWIGAIDQIPQHPMEVSLFNFAFAGSGDDPAIHFDKPIQKQARIRRLNNGSIDPTTSAVNQVLEFSKSNIFGWLDVKIRYEDLLGRERETKALFRIEHYMATSKPFGGNEKNYRT